MTLSRRDFLRRSIVGAAGAAVPPSWTVGPGPRAARAARVSASAPALGFPDPSRHWRGDSSVAAALRAQGPRAIAPRPASTAASPPVRPSSGTRVVPAARALPARFPDLFRHFVFEYYPWYSLNPPLHWNQDDHHPPVDIASNYMPRLGPYDSRSAAAIEQHAKWIRSSGAGAIDVSWWGQGSDVDQIVPTLMDVMAAYDVHVTFHIEPYSNDRAHNYASDIQYLITQYGERRHWDCFLLLHHADGAVGPVFKSFRTILPPQVTDCHGVTTPVPDYTSDAVWRQQTDRVRAQFASEFDRVTLLADSLDVIRTGASGFDGIAIYDNFVKPVTWHDYAAGFSARNLVFSFNINAGFDGVAPRHVDPNACPSTIAFEPGAANFDWSRAVDRADAAQTSAGRITESFDTTVWVQTDPQFADVSRGFFLAYINSFNEWHEGDAFEPMKNHADLTPAEAAVGYHNPDDGTYRLTAVTNLIGDVIG